MSAENLSQKTFAITTPLYYVNDLPHIGSAYTTMAADVLARFERLRGKSVLLITGTDEHGQKIQRTSESLGRSPQVHCDQIATGFMELWSRLNIQYDRFSRTTTPKHEAIVKEFFYRVWEQGDIYLGQQQGWYCVHCEEFKEEKDLLDDHRCAIHTNKQVEWRDESNYFFKLSKYQQDLEKLYQENPLFIQPETRKNEILNFVQQGLKDFSISRVNVTWGIPVPEDTSQTLYVWFDALLGYITALLDEEAEPTLNNALAKWYPINIHLIGKDILRFHAVYWPAMLMSAKLPLSERIFSHGFLTKDGQKMGKSLGNTIDPIELVNKYGSDAIRYYFLKEIEFGKDGDFNETRFIHTVNADLANDLGNLLNRTLGMVKKYLDYTLSDFNVQDIPSDHPLKLLGERLSDRTVKAYESLEFNKACEEILSIIRASNKLIDEQAPWTLYKKGEIKLVAQLLYTVLESVRLAAYLLSPIIPEISNKIYAQLGFNINFNDAEEINIKAPFSSHSTWGTLSPGQNLAQPSPIFARLESK